MPYILPSLLISLIRTHKNPLVFRHRVLPPSWAPVGPHQPLYMKSILLPYLPTTYFIAADITFRNSPSYVYLWIDHTCAGLICGNCSVALFSRGWALRAVWAIRCLAAVTCFLENVLLTFDCGDKWRQLLCTYFVLCNRLATEGIWTTVLPAFS